MDLSFNFQGLMAPVFTPFDEYQNINYDVIPKYAKYLHDSNIKGILVNGTTGEGVSLTLQERQSVLENWMTESENYDLTVMAQIGGTNMKDVKSLAAHAEGVNVHAILCLPDLFFKPESVDDLIAYLRIVSGRAPNTPLLYYHIPSFTGVKLDVTELLERSSKVPTLVGIKFTDSNLITIGSYLAKDQSNHSVFLGCDTHFISALFMGFKSAISTSINIFPHCNERILSYFLREEYGLASLEQQVLNHNIQEITKHGPWVSSMKEAMRKLTPIDVGPVRDPLKRVSFEVDSLDIKPSLQK